MAASRNTRAGTAAGSAAQPAVADPAATVIAGDMTIYRAAELRVALLAQIEAGVWCFDLAGVTDIDSAGLQLLAAVRASVAHAGGRADFVDPAPCVREACATCGLDSWLSQVAEAA